MIIDLVLTVLLCGLILAFLREAFNYRHIFQRKKTKQVKRATGHKHQKKAKKASVSQSAGPAQAKSTKSLTKKFNLEKLGVEGDSYTVTTVTTNGKSQYQFTDSSGKVQGYTSLEDMDPEVKAVFEGSFGNMGSIFGDIELPATSAEGVLASSFGKKTEKPSSVATKRKPPKKPATAGSEKLNYIPLDPEEFSPEDEGEES